MLSLLEDQGSSFPLRTSDSMALTYNEVSDPDWDMLYFFLIVDKTFITYESFYFLPREPFISTFKKESIINKTGGH